MHRETATPHDVDASLAASGEPYRLSPGRFRDDAIVVLDRSGRVATWNPGAERIRPDGQAQHGI